MTTEEISRERIVATQQKNETKGVQKISQIYIRPSYFQQLTIRNEIPQNDRSIAST